MNHDYRIGATDADLKFNVNEDGTLYFVVVPSNASAPNSSQIKAGTDGQGNLAVDSGYIAASFSSPNNVHLSGLTPGNTNYTLYVTAEDAAHNVFSPIGLPFYTGTAD
ncbi:hypothetical protein [Brevibacillus parabrevis]|uniref:hypothetical protein n=1 Tax=Brevibacillus parabrevis TaxID=54914 RepID=UPI001F625CD6|nr:hypothetical protein [Brevibacillus parabrevis]